jgi:hypothetical protein
MGAPIPKGTHLMTLRILAALGVGLLTIVMASAQLGSTTASPRVGGVPSFEVDPAWRLVLPNNWLMGVPSTITVDSHDHLWVLHRPGTLQAEQKASAAPPVLEFDATGMLIQAWGGPGKGYEWPDTEHSLFVDRQDNVWIGGNNPTPQGTRSDDMLLKFTSKGQFVWQFGRRHQSRGNADTNNLNGPADMFVDPTSSEVFVADGYGNQRVIVLTAARGAFARMWGAFGNLPTDPPSVAERSQSSGSAPARPVRPTLDTEGPGSNQFNTVHAIKISNDDLVYAADRANRRVQIFTKAGKYLDQVFINRTGPSLNSASGIAFSSDVQQRFMYVADFGNAQVLILNRQTLDIVGSFGHRRSDPGDFQGLHHLATDARGNLYTTEVAAGNRVQKFLLKPDSDRLRGIPGVIADGTVLEAVTGDFVFTEGPVGTPDGGLYFTEIRANRIYCLAASGRMEVYREHSKGANGLALDNNSPSTICHLVPRSRLLLTIKSRAPMV